MIYAERRFPQHTAGTLSWQNYDDDGGPAEPAGTVTVTIADATGTAIVTDGATAGTGSDPRTYAFTAANAASLGTWTVTWTDDGDGSTHTQTVEIVGGDAPFLFSIPEARARTDRVASTSKWPTSRLEAARLELTEELEWITDRSFCLRSHRLTVDGSGERGLYLPHNDLVEVTAVTVAGTAFSAAQLAALLVDEDNWVYRPEGSVWTYGRRNVVITYTFGVAAPPQQLKGAAIHRLADMVNRTQSNLPDRATHLTNEHGTIQLARAGTYRTGNAEVDAVYQRFSKRRMAEGDDGNSKPAAASMSLQYDIQYDSLFHGGRR